MYVINAILNVFQKWGRIKSCLDILCFWSGDLVCGGSPTSSLFSSDQTVELWIDSEEGARVILGNPVEQKIEEKNQNRSQGMGLLIFFWNRFLSARKPALQPNKNELAF